MSGTQSRGFIGVLDAGTTSANYWDTQTSGQNSSSGATGRTTAQLQTPTSATSTYASWSSLNVDGENPWDYGTSTQYPVLSYGGMDVELQFNSQPQVANLAPSFGGGSVTDKTYVASTPVEFQFPAATGGNGALTYTAYQLPEGLSLDSDGTGTCGRARTICGTPTATGTATVRIAVTDQDHTDIDDRDTMTFAMTVTAGAAITATSPSPLTEANVNSATVTVTLYGTTFVSGANAFSLSSFVPGLLIASISSVSAGDTTATLTLLQDGTNFDRRRQFRVVVSDASHTETGNLTSPPRRRCGWWWWTTRRRRGRRRVFRRCRGTAGRRCRGRIRTTRRSRATSGASRNRARSWGTGPRCRARGRRRPR